MGVLLCSCFYRFYAAEAVYYSTTFHINHSIPRARERRPRHVCLECSSWRGSTTVCHEHESLFSRRPFRRFVQFSQVVRRPWLDKLGMGSDRIPCSNWRGLDVLLNIFLLSVPAIITLFANTTSESTLDWQTRAVADYMKGLKPSKSPTSSP